MIKLFGKQLILVHFEFTIKLHEKKTLTFKISRLLTRFIELSHQHKQYKPQKSQYFKLSY